jgi:hypothetical protein
MQGGGTYMLDTLPTILTYGALGLATILAYLTFRLLSQESQKKKPNEGMLRATNRFMITSIVLALVCGPLAILDTFVKGERRSSGTSDGYGGGLSAEAGNSFLAGGDAQPLSGKWRVTWYMPDENGGQKKLTFEDEQTGETKESEPETIKVITNKNNSTISCFAQSSRTKNVKYWLEGRISKEKTVTLLYWSPAAGECESLVGVVYLQYYSNWTQKNTTMKGWWIGYTHDKSPTASEKVTRGEVIWEKLD